MPKRRISDSPVPTAVKKADLGIEREIAEAARRIRWQDGFTGLAGIAVLILAYATAMVVLDRWLVLPQWVRQIAFGGFLASLGTVAYFFILRPLQRSVNPRFIARQLENTQSETKNEIINWVDMREKDIPASIRDSVNAQAAEGLAEADVNTAVRSGKIAWLGGAAMVLVGVLAVLFLVFKAGQFTSLLGRAFNPFTTTVIGTRTKIALLEPQPADLTITDGEQLRFLVNIDGKKPSTEGPDRVRLKIRQSQDDPQWEEIPFSTASNSREFDLTLGRSAIRNGFWYRVAAGDAETPEHRVDVRTRPLIQSFEVRYEYPAYTRMVPDVGREPRIEAHRGTTVTLTVKTNRQLKSGSISFDGKPVPLAGEVPTDAKDSLRFRFKLEERSNYRVQFTTTANESSGPSPAYPVEVILDRAPTALIDAPEAEEITLPVNGQLAVDGTITDDFGLETAALVIRIPKADGTAIELRKKYLAGESLKRAKDGIHPTSLNYKDSIRLDGLKTDAGQSVPLQPEMVLEYWLEATDNCTEPKPNVGKSAVKRVKLTLPPATPEKKQEQEQKAGQRQADEKNQQQGEKAKRENTKPQKPQQRPDRQPEKKEEPGANDQQPDPMVEPNPMDKGPGEKPNEPKNGGNDKPNPDDVKRKADELQNKIDQQNKEPADTKPNPNEADPMMGEEKPGEGKANGGKPESKEPQDSKAGEPKEGASESKEGGKVQPPENATEKPKPEENPTGNEKDKPEPRGGQAAGEEKPGEKKEGSPKGQESGEGKNEQPKPEDGKEPEKNPGSKAGKSKSDGQPKPSEEKATEKPSNMGEENANPQEQPGESKGDKPEKSGSKKGGPKEPPMGNKPGEEKPKTGNEATEGSNEKGMGQEKAPPMGGGDPKGSQKESKPQPGNGGGEKQPTKEEIAQAEKDLKDLTSKDDKTRKEAEKRLDDQIGKENREAAQRKAEQLEKDSQSEDKEKRDAAQGELQRMAQENAKKNQKRDPRKGDADQLNRDAEDLSSDDPKKRQDAEQRLDDQIGKENRDELQKKSKETKKDRESGDPDKKAKAEQDLKNQADKAAQAGKNGQGKPDQSAQKEPTKEEMDQFKKDAQDLNSPDEKTRKDAEKRIDDKIGKENREAAQKKAKDLENDLKSSDKDKKAKAEKELEDLAKKAQGGKPDQTAQKEPTKEEMDQFKKDVQDLNSPDEKTRKEAEKRIDDKIGKENREKAQAKAKQLEEDLKSPDKDKQAKAEQELKDIAKKAGGGKPDETAQKNPTKEEIEQLQKDAQDLASKDEQTRKQAEKKLDEKLGKEKREELQKDMQDLASNDPKKVDEAKKRIEEKLKDEARKQETAGNGGKGPDGKPIDDNKDNRVKTAERQLEQFKKYRGDKKFLKDNNMTEAEYDKFLRGYEEMLAKEKQQIENEKLNPPTAQPAGPTTVGSNDGSGGRVEKTPSGTAVEGPGGSGVAPPGYNDAQGGFTIPRRPKK